ncbi:MAG: ABC transporter permease [Longimicrobiales bacterium]
MRRLRFRRTLRRDRALQMMRYLVRRLLLVPLTVMAIVTISFIMIHAAPGDPVLALAGEHGDRAYYEFMRERFGFDDPLPTRFVTYASRVLRGDFGNSYVQGRSAAALIAERVPATLLLTASALVLGALVSIPLGLWTARRAGGRWDGFVNFFALTLYSMPLFWVGQMAVVVFAARMGWLPVEGIATAGSDATGIHRVTDLLQHLALPAVVLASHEIAVLTRLVRSGVAQELGRDHVRMARASGLSERVILLRHALPRPMLTVVTVVGTRIGQLFAGALVVEIVFGWPGMGRLLLSALQARDAPILLAFFFLVSCSVVIANLVADVIYAAIDPRIRYG